MSRASSTGLVARWMPPFVRANDGPDAASDPAVPALLDRSTRVPYFAVAATRRYRASQRRRLQDATRQAMVLVLLAALSNAVWVIPFHPDAIAFVVGLNSGVGIVAAIGYLWVRTRARRHPEAVVFVVLVAVDVATITLGTSHPGLSLVAVGYLLLLPTIVALLVPWQTRNHIAWLALHGAATVAYIFFAREQALPGGRDEMLTLLVIAIAASQFGHVTALRSRVIGFVQIESIRALHRRARRDAARMDHLNEVLERTARTDELTGLKNRVSLKRDLRAVHGRIARHRERYSMLVLDLDRFKAINDAFGHAAGDRVLRRVAESLLNVMRAEDSAYRYGGEEFLVLMEVAEPGEELVAAERIRRIVEDLDLPNPGNAPHGRVTVSVGVASVGPDDVAGDDDAWFNRADAAMYRAKARGRNRCEGAIGPVSAS